MIKTGKYVGLCLTILTLAGCRAKDGGPPSIQESCTQTINAYAHSRDSGDVEGFRQLFTPDARFTIRGETQTGRDAIVEGMQSRMGTTVSRHIIGSILIEEVSRTRAKGQSYVMVFIGDGEGTPPFDLSMDKFFGIATYWDEFQISGEVCRISDRRVEITFAKKP